MSVEGLCAICENSTADHGCDLCGRMVCETHYETPAGVCVECGSGSGGQPTGGGEKQDRPDGVDEHQF
ncbi:hypothetical protein HWV07_18145 [Natronomonas salina]|uniref:hypothetical protein n=1 Tax=Natronomonas salina TaxID=1710540 RepID=UPI0015B6C3D8|nr:hypothetical protein [Natronomonas salina]QLD90859.1 hypothetical protein HWV07_18145 [Natronomonas salina]